MTNVTVLTIQSSLEEVGAAAATPLPNHTHLTGEESSS